MLAVEVPRLNLCGLRLDSLSSPFLLLWVVTTLRQFSRTSLTVLLVGTYPTPPRLIYIGSSRGLPYCQLSLRFFGSDAVKRILLKAIYGGRQRVSHGESQHLRLGHAQRLGNHVYVASLVCWAYRSGSWKSPIWRRFGMVHFVGIRTC